MKSLLATLSLALTCIVFVIIEVSAQTIEAQSPTQLETAERAGLAALESGDLEAAVEAIGSLEQAISAGLGGADTLVLLGRLLAHYSDDLFGALRAAEAFERAFVIRHDDAELCRDLAASYRRIGLGRQGLEAIEACEAPARGPGLWLERGRILDRMGRYHEAREAMHQAAAAGAGASADYELGLMAITNRDVETAMAALQRAVAREPGMAPAHLRLGSLLIQAGEIDTAITSLRRAIEASPRMAEAHHLLGRALADAGEPEAALAALDDALTVDAELLPAAQGRIETLQALGREEEARVAMDELAAMQQVSREAESGDFLNIAAATHNIHGLYYYRRGDLAAAVERFQLALAIFPDNALLHENLARAYAAGGDHELAVDALNRAIEADPRRPDAYVLLTGQYRALGRHDEASHVEARYRALLEQR